MWRRALALASAASALRASVAQLPPAALPAAGTAAAFRVRHAGGRAAHHQEQQVGPDHDGAAAWAVRVAKPRGSAKSAKAPGKRQAARSDDVGSDGADGGKAHAGAGRPSRAATADAQQQQPPPPPSPPPPPPPPSRVVEVPDRVSVKELARALEVSVSEVEAVMTMLDDAPTTEEELVKPDTAELVALELGGVELRRKPPGAKRRGASPPPADGAAAAASGDPAPAAAPVVRGPVRRAVVAVLGHVDHGKTTLLDSLRATSVAATEAGGITQHVGAFVVALPGAAGAGGSLTFLDTPGHAAFTAMRARGAACTDVCVLVVAADDGVMPQTVEALAHARAAGCPVVVALTKCDKHTAQPARVRRQLLELGLETEDVGGAVQVVEVSALTGAGLAQLSEALLLEADALDLRADAAADGEGVVLEARLDRGHGPLATALLRSGSLTPGCVIVAGTHWGRVRALRDATGKQLPSAGPSDPVEVAGLRSLPSAGDPIQVVASEERARRITAARAQRAAQRAAQRGGGGPGTDAPVVLDAAAAAAAVGVVGASNRAIGGGAKAARKAAREAERAAAAEAAAAGGGGEGDEEGQADAQQQLRELVVLIKADVQGTGEALRYAVQRLSSGVVRVRVLHCGVGPVTESDVDLAAACGAPILAFNVRVGAAVDAAAKRAGVRIASQRVIYHLLDDVGAMLTGLAPERDAEEVAGEAEVLQLFAAPAPKKASASASASAATATPAASADGGANMSSAPAPIAGCRVKSGTIHAGERFRILRGGMPLHDGLLPCRSIRRQRLDVQTVGKGTECGVLLGGVGTLEVRPGDVLQCVRMVRVRARTEAVEGGGLRVTDEAV